MKRFVLFTGDNYYPAGGWDDYQDDFDTFAEAQRAGKPTKTKYGSSWDWFHIIDLETGEKYT